MARSGFGAAQAIRRDSGHVRLSRGTGLAEMLRPEHLGAMLWEPKMLGGQSPRDRAVVARYVVFTRGNLRLVSIRT